MCVRIIPARAGFTARTTSGLPEPWDHPRSRGVYLDQPVVVRNPVDHPRSRGVYGGRFRVSLWRVGSSPLARGLPRRSVVEFGQARIIPARAGFTGLGDECWQQHGDHPRSRGVYAATPRDSRSMPGSSPLARGLREAEPQEEHLRRIIPARAGFTSYWRHAYDCETDHPRSRGVYTHSGVGILPGLGSSPLARGLRGHIECLRERPGIIPARAGFTGDITPSI